MCVSLPLFHTRGVRCSFPRFLGGSYRERWAGSETFIGVTVFEGSSTCSHTERCGEGFLFLCRMKMLSPANGDQLHLVNYVEDYLDSIESMPFDLQRNVSLMREIDAKYQGKCFLYICVPVCVVWGSGGKGVFPFLFFRAEPRLRLPLCTPQGW